MSRIIQIGLITNQPGTAPIQIIQVTSITEFEEKELKQMFEQLEAIKDTKYGQQKVIVFDYIQCYDQNGYDQKKLEEFLEIWGSNHMDKIKEALSKSFDDSFDVLKAILQALNKSLAEEIKMAYKLFAEQLKTILKNQDDIITRLKRIEANQQ